tara:strand:+ start:148 stop:504 length:357 start_codon:yes stop_codon:yes gene_type:complete
MKLRKAQGSLYSVLLISYVDDANHGYDAPSVDKQVVVNTVSKVISVVNHLGEMEGFTLPHEARFRADLAQSMPSYRYKTKSSSGITYEIYVKQHAISVGVTINANVQEEVDIVECPPF